MEIIGYILAIFVGISLGLIGGGGAILTVPILVYLFAIKPELATTYSLFIVGISSLIGSIKHYKQGNLKINTALSFGLPALLSLLTIRKIILPKIPQQLFQVNTIVITKNILLMVVFAVLMIAASISMIRKTKAKKTEHQTQQSKLIFYGLLVGIVTGFLGAGGGFLIIPALIFFANLEMKQAVGTSLLIIASNALIGFAGDMINGVVVDFRLLFSFSLLAITGIFIGTYFSKKINGNTLKPAFGWFVLAMGLYIIAKEIL